MDEMKTEGEEVVVEVPTEGEEAAAPVVAHHAEGSADEAEVADPKEDEASDEVAADAAPETV
jgi:hypothetical protein